MTVTNELIEKYKDKTKIRKVPLSIVIQRANTEEDIENMLKYLEGYYTEYLCDECDAPMIREFSPFDYDATEESEEIYRCLNGHRFQTGGKFFKGLKRLPDRDGVEKG